MAKQADYPEAVTLDLRPVLMPFALIISSLILGVSFAVGAGFVGGGLANVGGITTTTGTTTTTTTGTDTTAVDTTGTADPTIATVSIDDDAIKGNKDAKVFIVEFSDYECPFCQIFYNDTLGALEENFVDTGEVAFVYRDLPLSFHEPGASREANAAECVRDQLGDGAYYSMHDYIFDNTPGNGPGISVDDLTAFGGSIGANENQLRNCIENEDFAAEIQADADAAAAIGINGTPGFVVGTIDGDGNVTGEVISGAYPYATFEAAILSYL